MICHKDDAYYKGRGLVEELREFRARCSMCRSNSIGSRIISRETVKAMRRTLAKCYGGDVSRSANYWRSRRKARPA